MKTWNDVITGLGYTVDVEQGIVFDDRGDERRLIGSLPVPTDEAGVSIIPGLDRLYSAFIADNMAANNLPWFDPGTPGNFLFPQSRQWVTLSPAQQAYLISIRNQGGMDFFGWVQERLGLAYDRGYGPDETVRFVAQGVLNGPAILAAAQAAYEAKTSFSAVLKTIVPLALAFVGGSMALGSLLGAASTAANLATDAALLAGEDAAFLIEPLAAAGDEFVILATDAVDAAAAAESAVSAADAAIADAAAATDAAGFSEFAAVDDILAAPSVVDSIDAAKSALDVARMANDNAAIAADELVQLTADTTNAAAMTQQTGVSLADAKGWLQIAGGVISAAVALYKASKGTATTAPLPVRNSAGQLVNPTTGQVLQQANGQVLDPATGQFVTPGGAGVLSQGIVIGGVNVPLWALGVGAWLLLKG